MRGGTELCILKSERKILVFAIPHLFMAENFQFSLLYWYSYRNWPTAFCILSTSVVVVVSRSCVCVKRKFYRNFPSSFSSFYVFSCCCRCKISTYVQNYMYEHIKSHFLKDMKTPLSLEDERKRRNFHIYTRSSVEFF